jgi:signal transduction histidine kinase
MTSGAATMPRLGRAGAATSPRLEMAGIAILVLLLNALPVALHGWPATLAGNVAMAALLASGLTLMWWRTHPRLVAVVGGALWLVVAVDNSDVWLPQSALAIMVGLAAAVALAWTGRAAWLAGLGLAGYLYVFWLVLPPTSPVAIVMFSVPGFLAGTVLRQRGETVDQLARRGRELEEERELFAQIALRHERARIASELHDIIGHAISVMVIQAAAGQRLVGRDQARAEQAFAAIAESARQGREDLHRLVELLGGTETSGPDLTLIDEVVTRAARSGLDVSCRFEGGHDAVAAGTAHIAFRVVQESLTNALRYAPGAAVRVLVNGSGTGLTVRVENDRSVQERLNLAGTGRGLTGLRERVQELGGQLLAGPTPHGGWRVEATLPS